MDRFGLNIYPKLIHEKPCQKKILFDIYYYSYNKEKRVILVLLVIQANYKKQTEK